ncbi:MAG: MBL fold metallo-hydrolase [Candidatus Hodarchaeota archaeon]
MRYEEINQYVLWTEEGRGNVVAIDLGNYIITVDSMIGPKPARQWRELLEDIFQGSVKALILTHHHADHVFGNQVFTDCPIYSSLTMRERMLYSEKHYWTPEEIQGWSQSPEGEGLGLENLRITYPTVCFNQELTIYGEERKLVIKRTDGHTLGSSYAFEPLSKTLIASDLIFNQRFPFGGDLSVNPILWYNAMEELISLKPKIIISGHGPIATNEDLVEIRNFIKYGIDIIKRKLKNGLSPKTISKDPDLPDYYTTGREELKEKTFLQWAKFLHKKID